MKFHSLSELGKLSKKLKQQRQQAEQSARQQLQARKKARLEANLFARSVGPVTPLKDSGRVHNPGTAPEPLARQRERDEQAALLESLSDAFDPSTLLQTDEYLSYRRPRIGPDIPQRLRRGDWTIQAEIDLHGMRSDEARQSLGNFLRLARKKGLRCVRIVHGKGLGSPGKIPVLKGKVHAWLVQKSEVIAFVQARPEDGGAGALIVLLAAHKKQHRFT